jgi:O-antigen ligase
MISSPKPGFTVDASNQILLLAFIVFYPLILFPGALFSTPGLITESTIAQATERFLLLPKIIALLLIGLLGFLQVWKNLPRDSLVILMGLHLIWVVVGVINARDEFTYGLLGPYLRLDGLVYHLGLTGLALFTYTLLKHDAGLTRPIIYALIASGTIQASLAILQRLDLDPIGPMTLWQSFTQPMGSLSHPGYLAGMLLPLIVLGIWSFDAQPFKWSRAVLVQGGINMPLADTGQKRASDENPHGFSRVLAANFRRAALVVCILLMSLGLAFTGNQTGFFALILALPGLILLRPRWSMVGLCVAVLLCLLLGGQIFSGAKQSTLSESYSNTTTLKTRAIIWALSLDLSKKIPLSPLLGGGPDALRLSILRHLEPIRLIPLYRLESAWPNNAAVAKVQFEREAQAPLRMTLLKIEFSQYGQEKDYTESFPMTLDRAHNFWLDRFLASGLLGVLTWIAIYLYPLIKAKNYPQHPWVRGLSIAILALMVYYFFWFPVAQVEPLHLMLAVLIWANQEDNSSRP